MENFSINVEFHENNAGQVTAGAYLLYIAEIVNCAQQQVFIVNIYISG